jgi:hypothetical protein
MLCVAVLFVGSVVYKQQNTMVCYHFPVPESLKKQTEAVPFYIFLFFSRNDCIPCLVEIVKVLDTLPSQFCVAGIVPEDELKDKRGLMRLSGASFPFYSNQEYKKYLPWHTPTLFGVSPSGKIIFVLPGIPGQRTNIKHILSSIYGKLYPSFKRENIPIKGGSKR